MRVASESGWHWQCLSGGRAGGHGHGESDLGVGGGLRVARGDRFKLKLEVLSRDLSCQLELELE